MTFAERTAPLRDLASLDKEHRYSMGVALYCAKTSRHDPKTTRLRDRAYADANVYWREIMKRMLGMH